MLATRSTLYPLSSTSTGTRVAKGLRLLVTIIIAADVVTIPRRHAGGRKVDDDVAMATQPVSQRQRQRVVVRHDLVDVAAAGVRRRPETRQRLVVADDDTVHRLGVRVPLGVGDGSVR